MEKVVFKHRQTSVIEKNKPQGQLRKEDFQKEGGGSMTTTGRDCLICSCQEAAEQWDGKKNKWKESDWAQR